MTDRPASGRPPIALPIVLAAWFAAALAAGAAGLVRSLPPPGLQLTVLGVTVLLVAAGFAVAPLRRWALRVPLRLLVATHVTRLVGFQFLALFQRAELPFAFAVPGGWGDVLAAGFALALVLAGPPTTLSRWRAYLTWNVLAFLDLLYVVVTAARLALADPGSMAPLLRLPLSLLPTFLVPILLATHVLIAVRLARERPLPAGGAEAQRSRAPA